MKYRRVPKWWKYQLLEDEVTDLESWMGRRTGGIAPLVWLTEGVLTLRQGYAWNGASGPTIDTETNMRASLVHDALYQLLRRGELRAELRRNADRVFRDICLEDGMASVRAALDFRGLRWFGGRAARSKRRIEMEN